MTIPDPYLIPASAIAAGTLHQPDRSRQYVDPDPKELLRSQNDAWLRIRLLEKSNGEKDAAILQLERRVAWYRTKNIALTAIITGMALEGAKALIAHLVH